MFTLNIVLKVFFYLIYLSTTHNTYIFTLLQNVLKTMQQNILRQHYILLPTSRHPVNRF